MAALGVAASTGAATVALAAVAGPWATAAAATAIAGLSGSVVLLGALRQRDCDGQMVSRAQLERIVDSLQEGFALFDEQDRLALCNSRYRAMFALVDDRMEPGTPFEELVRLAARRGQNVEAIADAEEWVRHRLAVHRQPAGRFEHRFTDGRWIWVEETRTPGGRTLSTYVDITHLKQREAELEAAKERAEEADQAKRDFLSNLSHELRTPLNAIIAFSEIISRGVMGPVTPPAYGGYAESIHDSGLHLYRLIDRMLDMAKIEAGRMDLEEEDVAIDALFESCVRFVSERAAQERIDLTVTHSDVVLHADELRLKQIVLNLLSNAIKFTPPGGAVRLTLDIGADDPTIAVTDNGPGMTAKEIEVALTPFGQVEGSYARRHEGTGLGLPLAMSLAELHGGDLTIESAPDEGTTVRVRLPRERLVPVRPAVPAVRLVR